MLTPSEHASPIVLVGGTGGTNVAASLARGAATLGLPHVLLDILDAYGSPGLRRSALHALGRWPARAGALSAEVIRRCTHLRARVLLVTGHVPITVDALDEMGRLGILRMCWLTDDPWNKALRTGWFLEPLTRYDVVFTTRRANLADLQRHCGRAAVWMPFAYDESLFRANGDPPPAAPADLLFVGGADNDRIPILNAVISAGLRPELFGGYWDQCPATRPYAGGFVGPDRIRRATQHARVSLCLVRRANRDGHVMRSYEIPACGGVPLIEDTPEHRDLYGAEEQCALFFSTVEELIAKALRLQGDLTLARRLAMAAHARITAGANTYRDRLVTMLRHGTRT